MQSKKFNIFTLIFTVVLCGISIFLGVFYRGKDGLSAYELAKESGQISQNMSKYEYLESLRGKDGSNVTMQDVYEAYLEAKDLTSEDLSFTEFILTYYPDKIIDENASLSMVEATTQSALRSTVDICYGYYDRNPIVYVSENNGRYIIDETNSGKYAATGVSAGSGVIYKMDENTAYIITNYHVVYCNNYSNDDNYYVYYNNSTSSYFTGTYEESKIKTGTNSTGWGFSQTYKYLNASDITAAPIETHFLESYGVYVYGYQSEKYEISATFVGGSANNDIAILKVDKNASTNNRLLFNGDYKAVDIGDSTTLNEGQTIVAVGNPLLADTTEANSNSSAQKYVEAAKQAYVDALCLTSTAGEISNLSEQCKFESLLESGKAVNMRLIRVSSAINAGNSGGGLYSTDGRLVGIVNGKIESESYDNVGYAIPVNVAVAVADQVIAQCDNKKSVEFKAVTLSSLGLEVKNGASHTYYDSNSLTFKILNDVEVSFVSGLSQSSGLAEGDVIQSIEIGSKTYKVNNYYDVSDLLLLVKTTDSLVKFNISRLSGDNSSSNLQITININSNNFVKVV